MTDFYWYNPSGSANWTNTGASGRWYSASGGTGTKFSASVPGVGDNAIFDANSGAGICNFPNSATGNCLNLYCNGYGAVGPTTTQISGGPSSVLNIYGSIALSPNQIFDLKQTPKLAMVGSGAGSISTNGNSFGDLEINKTAATVTLNDDLIGIGNATLILTSGTLNANNKNVTFGAFFTGTSASKTLTMGSGTWTMTFESEISSLPINTWQIDSSVSGLTFNKDTATIRFIHARNDPASNSSQSSGLRTALINSATTIDLTDVTGFSATYGTNNSVLIGNEVITYTGVNTTTRQLTGLTRGVGGTTTLASVPAGTAVIGVLFGNSVLTAPIVAGVSTTITVTDSSQFPQAGVVWIENEQISYTGNSLGTNQLTGISVPTNNHAINAKVYSYQAKNFYGGNLTYNNIVFGCFGYKIQNNIYGSNSFTNIKNNDTGFTWSSNSNVYPGFQTLYFQTASSTTTLSAGLSFTGTVNYQQVVIASAAVTLSIVPATTGWYVGTHSNLVVGNTNLYAVSGFTDYIDWYYITALPNIAPTTNSGAFFLLF
jgi:hypothetical protein